MDLTWLQFGQLVGAVLVYAVGAAAVSRASGRFRLAYDPRNESVWK